MKLIFLCLTVSIAYAQSLNGMESLYRTRRQSSCTYNRIVYPDGETWTINAGSKLFQCTCTSGIPQCQWSATRVTRRRCYDRTIRRYRTTEEKWEKVVNGSTLDCKCEMNRRRRMQIYCSGENRCHRNGTSYRKGDDWIESDVTGFLLDCVCLGNEKISCKGSVTTELPSPEINAQWVEDHIVYGQQILRPRIATLQACDTGTRVVRSGYEWNQTTSVESSRVIVERCVCRNALISCRNFTITRNREPHCVTDDGVVRVVGESWNKVHYSHDNIRWICRCQSNGQVKCRDVGYCVDPHAPPNGAMLCVAAGKAGPKQSLYCKPMCAQGYKFFNPRRLYRIWEVCSHVTTHRWSGGFVEDPLLIGKCIRENPIAARYRLRRTSLYLPTSDCRELNDYQIREIQLEFIKHLNNEKLCNGKCQTKFFRCGAQGN